MFSRATRAKSGHLTKRHDRVLDLGPIETLANWTNCAIDYDCYSGCWGACNRNAAMPVLAYFAVAGSVLVALLFLADATLEKNNSPVIVTSQRSGLPETPQHPDAEQVITPAPAPDMTSQAVLSAQPKTEPEHQAIPAEAHAARAEARPKQDAGRSATPKQRRHAATQLPTDPILRQIFYQGLLKA